jgi:hypothetical protein
MKQKPLSHVDKEGFPKIGYPTRKIAKMNAKRLSIKYHKKYDVYPCPECNQYHIGTHSEPKTT